MVFSLIWTNLKTEGVVLHKLTHYSSFNMSEILLFKWTASRILKQFLSYRRTRYCVMTVTKSEWRFHLRFALSTISSGLHLNDSLPIIDLNSVTLFNVVNDIIVYKSISLKRWDVVPSNSWRFEQVFMVLNNIFSIQS